MMARANPTGQVILINQTPPVYPPSPLIRDSPSEGDYAESKSRFISGVFTVVCGVIEMILGIALVCLPYYSYLFNFDYIGWGIGNGIFVIITGCFGVCSKGNRCQVNTYVALSIIATVTGVICLGFTIASASTKAGYYYYGRANLAIYVTLCITFVVQIISSIFGSCDERTSENQTVINNAPQMSPPQTISVFMPNQQSAPIINAATGIDPMPYQPVLPGQVQPPGPMVYQPSPYVYNVATGQMQPTVHVAYQHQAQEAPPCYVASVAHAVTQK